MKRIVVLSVVFFFLLIMFNYAFSQGLPQLIGSIPDPAEVLGEDGQTYKNDWQYKEKLYHTYLYTRPVSENDFLDSYIKIAEKEGYRVEKTKTDGFPSLKISIPLTDDTAFLLYDYQGYMLFMVPTNIPFILRNSNDQNNDGTGSKMSPDEANRMGDSYKNGDGVNQSYSEAVKYYRIAAEQGDPEGQCNLGVSYHYGNGVEKDDKEALKLFMLAADQGYARGQFNVGTLYERGNGVEQDYKVALKWYHLAADQNYPAAQYNIGNLYQYGLGVKKSYSEAAKWFRLAAEQGLAEAQNNLGYFHIFGWGVEQDYDEAAKWLNLAADQGYELAQKNLNLISPYVTWGHTRVPKTYSGFGTVEQKNDVGTLMRDKPSLSGGVMRSILNGTQIKYLGDSRTVDGIEWVNIETEEGQQGWVTESSISPIKLQ